MRSWLGAQFAFLGIPTLLVGRRATDFIRTRQPRGMRDGRRDPSGQIRSSLVQLATPDAMRGRVSAVNMLFIGASGELGAFESGVAASICLGLLKVSSSVASGRYWSWRYGWRRFPPSGMPTASSIRTSTGQSRSFDRYRKVKPSAILSIDASPIDGIDHVQSRPATDGAAHCTGSNGGRAKSGYQHPEALNTLSTGTC
jgi:hypothetical protein